MNKNRLAGLRAFSLCFLLPGFAGLLLSAGISTLYLNRLPRQPDPPNQRMNPRNINGYIIYQTDSEDRNLDLIEYSSVAVFLVGLGMGLVYLQKWGIARAIEAEDDEFVAEEG